jgi:hypothetical protein
MNARRMRAGLDELRQRVCIRRKRTLVKHCVENEPGANIRFRAIEKYVDKAA